MINHVCRSLVAIAASAAIATAHADNSNDQPDQLIEETVVIGDREAARRVAGSGTVLNHLF